MNNTIKILTKEQCYGCRSCEQICPKKSISLSADGEGFIYPQIEESICINCGLCSDHCPAVQKKEENENIRFLGLRLKDSEELMESSSGGAFAALADYVIENHGIVFGCAFDENLQAKHICVENKKDLKKIKGSKYVASDTLNTYLEVATILKTQKNIIVLYSGTPCQIHGLYSFLGCRPENLVTVDLICHGVPSQKLFNKYIEWLSNKTKSKILYYGFRDKDVSGWSCGGKIKTATKTKIINSVDDPYYSSFLRSENYRLSCYKCEFSNLNKRPADITIGDFWGIEIVHPDFYTKKGVSCCLLNTSKGKELFEKVKDRFHIIETEPEKITTFNGNLVHPTKKPLVRDKIYQDIDRLPSEEFIKKLYAPISKRIIRFLISKVPHSIKTFVKRKKYGL